MQSPQAPFASVNYFDPGYTFEDPLAGLLGQIPSAQSLGHPLILPGFADQFFSALFPNGTNIENAYGQMMQGMMQGMSGPGNGWPEGAYAAPNQFGPTSAASHALSGFPMGSFLPTMEFMGAMPMMNNYSYESLKGFPNGNIPMFEIAWRPSNHQQAAGQGGSSGMKDPGQGRVEPLSY